MVDAVHAPIDPEGSTGTFSPPLVDPNDTGNLTEGRSKIFWTYAMLA
jgi:hypothetical protein